MSDVDNFVSMLPFLCYLCYILAYFIVRRNVEKRSLLDHMEAVFLIIDELIDGG